MPAVSRLGDKSTGHGCFPPTSCTGGCASKTFANGIAIQVLQSQFQPHSCGRTTHNTSVRKTNAGSSTVFIEGKAAIRIGDPIICGDTVGQGSLTVQVGG